MNKHVKQLLLKAILVQELPMLLFGLVYIFLLLLCIYYTKFYRTPFNCSNFILKTPRKGFLIICVNNLTPSQTSKAKTFVNGLTKELKIQLNSLSIKIVDVVKPNENILGITTQINNTKQLYRKKLY